MPLLPSGFFAYLQLVVMIIDSVRWCEFAFGIDWAATLGDNVFNSESCGMENGNDLYRNKMGNNMCMNCVSSSRWSKTVKTGISGSPPIS